MIKQYLKSFRRVGDSEFFAEDESKWEVLSTARNELLGPAIETTFIIHFNNYRSYKK